jgi:hypothetical protein
VRTLIAAPDDALDPRTFVPRFGSYRGSVSRIEIDRVARGPLAPLARVARRKRWVYVAIARDPILVSLAIVRLGYAANAFVFVYHAGERRMLARVASLGPGFAADVSASAGPQTRGSYRLGGLRLALTPRPDTTGFDVEAAGRGFSIRARLDASESPPAIAAIAPVPGHLVATTEKRALLVAAGEVIADGRRFSLDAGLGAYDHTHGLLARHTAWRWAFGLGLAGDGEPVAVNLVEGHVGEAECAAWTRDGVHPLAEGRFDFDPARPLDPWHVTTADGSVDLRFAPGALHAETKNLGIIRSRFVQPAGTYDGTIRLADRTVDVRGLLGVAEDQDVLW